MNPMTKTTLRIKSLKMQHRDPRVLAEEQKRRKKKDGALRARITTMPTRLKPSRTHLMKRPRLVGYSKSD